MGTVLLLEPRVVVLGSAGPEQHAVMVENNIFQCVCESLLEFLICLSHNILLSECFQLHLQVILYLLYVSLSDFGRGAKPLKRGRGLFVRVLTSNINPPMSGRTHPYF